MPASGQKGVAEQPLWPRPFGRRAGVDGPSNATQHYATKLMIGESDAKMPMILMMSD
jgi:hypothetical protein